MYIALKGIYAVDWQGFLSYHNRTVMFPCLEGQKIVNGTFREFSQLLQWLPLLLMSLSYAPVSSKGQELWCLMEDYQQTSQSAFTADLFGAAQTSSGAFFLLGLAYLGEVKLLIEQPRKVVLSKFPSKLCCGFVCGEKKKQTNHRLFLFFCFLFFSHSKYGTQYFFKSYNVIRCIPSALQLWERRSCPV